MSQPPRNQSLADFDIHAKGAREAAEPLWEKMRALPGLYHSDDYGGYYVAARYADVLKVLMNPQIFGSSKGITLPPPTAMRSFHIPAEIDPPAHREYRALVTPFTTGDETRKYIPYMRAMVAQLLDGIATDAPVDFVRAFARPLPIMVTLHILGQPAEDAALLEKMVEDLHHAVATGVPNSAAADLTAYATRILQARKASAHDPNADIISSLLLGQAFDRPLNDEEQMSMVRLFLIGGFDTVSGALGAMMRWLASDPKAVAMLRAQPALIDAASEEIVRISSPSTYLRREVMEDTELGGQKLPKGSSVLIAFGAANLDPAQFACPHAVDPTRKPNRHLGFGAGHHRCIGSFIAKAQMRIAFEEIIARFDSFELADPDAIAYTTGLGQTISRLPMIFHRQKGL